MDNDNILNQQRPTFPFTQPKHLQAVGQLFGLNPKPYETARVLEIGCNQGENIFPQSEMYPNMQIEGVDQNPQAIEQAKAYQKQLKFKNIQFTQKDFESFKLDGHYDYILCHGVYSWVSQKARDNLLKTCKAHLAPQGIAYISYNTLPCWNTLLCLRDMIQYHTRSFESLEQKVQQARIFMQFLTKGLEAQNTPYTKFLKQELALMSQTSDAALYQEYLGPVNQPFYFHEFVSQIQTSGMAYLADAFVPMMYLGNLKESFSEKLSKINDIVLMGQYMDFIRNQRFRSTLLCHDKHTLNRHLKVEDITHFCLAYSGHFQSKLSEQKLKTHETITFESPGLVLTLQKPLFKTMISILHDRQGKPMAFSALVRAAMNFIGEEDETKAHAEIFKGLNLIRLILGGMLRIQVDEGQESLSIPEKPKALQYARLMALEDGFLPNLRHESLKLSFAERLVLQNLDGQHTREDLQNDLMKKIEDKTLTLKDETDAPLTDENEIKSRINQITLAVLQQLAQKAYLLEP